jgi:hypothetical protein
MSENPWFGLAAFWSAFLAMMLMVGLPIYFLVLAADRF